MQAPRTNGLAVVSFVSSLLWLFWVGSLAAVITGHMAMSRIDSSGGMEGGRGLAIAGLIIGYISIVPFLLISLIILLLRVP